MIKAGSHWLNKFAFLILLWLASSDKFVNKWVGSPFITHLSFCFTMKPIWDLCEHELLPSYTKYILFPHDWHCSIVIHVSHSCCSLGWPGHQNLDWWYTSLSSLLLALSTSNSFNDGISPTYSIIPSSVHSGCLLAETIWDLITCSTLGPTSTRFFFISYHTTQ